MKGIPPHQLVSLNPGARCSSHVACSHCGNDLYGSLIESSFRLAGSQEVATPVDVTCANCGAHSPEVGLLTCPEDKQAVFWAFRSRVRRIIWFLFPFVMFLGMLSRWTIIPALGRIWPTVPRLVLSSLTGAFGGVILGYILKKL